jgi:hypothetical protein
MSECLKSVTAGGSDSNRKLLFIAAILQLVENNSTNNDAALDDLLPEGRDIHQVKGVVQYPDNQRTSPTLILRTMDAKFTWYPVAPSASSTRRTQCYSWNAHSCAL